MCWYCRIPQEQKDKMAADFAKEQEQWKPRPKLPPKPEYRNPKPTVDIILNQGDKVLLIERKNPPHGWAFPGGFVTHASRSLDGSSSCPRITVHAGPDLRYREPRPRIHARSNDNAEGRPMIEITYSGNHKWLPERVIYVTKGGSHAYGTNIATSDIDYRGLFVAPKEFYFGYLNKIQEADKGFDPADTVLYELRRYFELGAQCNPNILEMLWTAPEDQLLVTPLVLPLIDIRKMFLSKQARHSFSGYAVSQLRRIEGHNRWLKLVQEGREPKMPTRAEFGLPELPTIPADQRQAAESIIRKKLEDWRVPMDELSEPAKVSITETMTRVLTEIKLGNEEDAWRAAARFSGISENMMVVVEKERKYNSKVKEYKQFEEWKANRNEARAELEAKHGFDTKHGMHLVRLMRMAKEILTEGVVKVKRPDAEELLSIRNGAWSYEQLMDWAYKQDAELEEIYKTSALPREPNRVELDKVCQHITDTALNGGMIAARGFQPLTRSTARVILA